MISSQKVSKAGMMKALGPGLLYAGAAIGASHLVQSTRAGASYGFELVWAVILINLFKYPFFEFSSRYTAVTGKSMIDGYREIGPWAVTVFFVLNIITATINFAAVNMVTTGLAKYLFGIEMSVFMMSAFLLLIIIIVLWMGKYSLLDSIMKLMLLALSLMTIITVVTAFGFYNSNAATGFVPPEMWDSAGIAFLLALMGWMPSPMETSVWPSLWAIERRKQKNYIPKVKETITDFNIGYIGAAIMALFFLGLGALVMYGTGESFSDSSVQFAGQIVSLYSNTLGDWSNSVITVIALLTMLSTSLTVMDAYPRALESCMKVLFVKWGGTGRKIYWAWVISLSIMAVVIIGFFDHKMKMLVDVATIIAFLTAPAFAYINYKVVNLKTFPKEYRPGMKMKILSWTGMVFLFGFSVIYLVTRFFDI